MCCITFIIRRLGTIGGYNKSLIKVRPRALYDFIVRRFDETFKAVL